MPRYGTIFVIFVLLIFFLIIYSVFDPRGYPFGDIERFKGCVTKDDVKFGGVNFDARQQNNVWFKDHGLIEPSRLEINQGIPIPLKYQPSIAEKYDKLNPALPYVDGRGGARSLYMFSYNKCKPECCLESPYSCTNGCVCLTKNQYDFIGSRGDNHNPSECTFEDSIF